MLRATDIARTIDRKSILRDCSLELTPGRFTAVVGPNGAGKSTLLRIISGEDQPTRGSVRLNEQPLRAYDSQALSRLRAVLPQHTTVNFPFTVEQVIEIGRYAHRSRIADNERIIAEVMQRTGLNSFSGRAYQTLSGGEQQRVQMARVMAQLWDEAHQNEQSPPKYLLLDEPTSSLDLAQQQVLLGLAKDLSRRSLGVLAILHDLNLAIQYADDILFLKNGGPVAYGPCQEVVTQEVIEETFSHPVKLIYDHGQTIVVPQANSFSHFVTLNGKSHEQHH